MEIGRSLPATRWLMVGLIAVLGLSVCVATGAAAASGPGHAVAAKKKKCKKHRRSASSAKKKKCKRKLIPVTLPAPAPLVRGTLTWPSGDVDLHAFDASGNHSGFELGPMTIVQGIPDSTHSPDAQSGGSETFTDNIFVVGGSTNREFAYAACFYANASATFTGVFRDGTSASRTIDGLNGQGYSITTTASGGPDVPATFSCP
jgi:hypothetical protein